MIRPIDCILTAFTAVQGVLPLPAFSQGFPPIDVSPHPLQRCMLPIPALALPCAICAWHARKESYSRARQVAAYVSRSLRFLGLLSPCSGKFGFPANSQVTDTSVRHTVSQSTGIVPAWSTDEAIQCDQGHTSTSNWWGTLGPRHWSDHTVHLMYHCAGI